jgi:uncharacterized protein YndB with AHSA1/START domain
MSGLATGEGLQLQLKKTIKTTRETAFAAWTKPEILRKWFGPGQMLPVEAEVDLRVGGKLRFVIEGVSPRSGQHMQITFEGVFREIVPAKKLSFEWEVAGDPGESTVVTVEFFDVEGGTEVVLTQDRIPNEELLGRNKMGWGGMLEKLAELTVR